MRQAADITAEDGTGHVAASDRRSRFVHGYPYNSIAKGVTIMDDLQAAKSKRVWQKVAPSYDKSMAFFERWLFGGGRGWVCSRARGEVLEVAVGTGLNLPHYSSHIQLTGVDFSSAMLDLARARAVRLGRNVDLRESDAQALPFGDASFDSVVCTLSLCSIPDNRAAITEMWRVLRPAGRLLLLDHVGSTWPPIWLVQKALEFVTVPTAGEHHTRRQLGLVKTSGFTIAETRRRKAGSVELIHATKPS